MKVHALFQGIKSRNGKNTSAKFKNLLHQNRLPDNPRSTDAENCHNYNQQNYHLIFIYIYMYIYIQFYIRFIKNKIQTFLSKPVYIGSSDPSPGADQKTLKEIMHFRHMTNMTISQQRQGFITLTILVDSILAIITVYSFYMIYAKE